MFQRDDLERFAVAVSQTADWIAARPDGDGDDFTPVYDAQIVALKTIGDTFMRESIRRHILEIDADAEALAARRAALQVEADGL